MSNERRRRRAHRGQLADIGYRKSEDETSANIVILNTCSIRDHAEQKVYSYLGPHAVRKKRGENVSSGSGRLCGPARRRKSDEKIPRD